MAEINYHVVYRHLSPARIPAVWAEVTVCVKAYTGKEARIKASLALEAMVGDTGKWEFQYGTKECA